MKMTGLTITYQFQPVINNKTNLIVSVDNGTPPYYYSLNGLEYQTGNTFTNLSYGFYVIHVIDNNQLKSYESLYIPKPSTLTVDYDCNGVNIILKRDDGKQREEYTDENGLTWTIIKNIS